jgi:SAM-dependent methyltransferase
LLEQQRQIVESQHDVVERMLTLPAEHATVLSGHASVLMGHSASLSDHSASMADQVTSLTDRVASLAGQVALLTDNVTFLERLRALPDRIDSQLDEIQGQMKADDARMSRVERLLNELVAREQPPVLEAISIQTGRSFDQANEVEQFVKDAYHLILRRDPDPRELVEGRERLEHSIAVLKAELLDGLLGVSQVRPGEESTSVVSVPAMAETPQETPPCRICGGELIYKWGLRVLRGRHLAHYHECRECQALQVVNPHWLDEAYAGESRPLAINPDPGRFSRNFTAFKSFSALQGAGLVPGHPVLLDFGGGYGLLAQMLKSSGFEVWQYDQHVPVPFLASDRCLSAVDSFTEEGFDLIFALEVLEHLTDPMTTLESLASRLKPGGTMMFSTELYQPGTYDRHWNYLATEWGQHVTFWSRRALAVAARRLGFSSLGFFPGAGGFFILVSRLSADVLRDRLTAALRFLGDEEHVLRAVAPWDLRTSGYLHVLEEPIVEPLADDGEGDALAGRGAA